jgi:hypothetical protein
VPDGSFHILAKFSGVQEATRRIEIFSEHVDDETERAVAELGEDAELIYATFALHGTSGRLARGITAQKAGPHKVIVRADARNPRTGFDYVAVTRFGHKVFKIVPKHDRAPATILATHKARKGGGLGALMFSIGGNVLFRKSTKGFHPTTDWADRARPHLEEKVQTTAVRLARRIEVW